MCLSAFAQENMDACSKRMFVRKVQATTAADLPGEGSFLKLTQTSIEYEIS